MNTQRSSRACLYTNSCSREAPLTFAFTSPRIWQYLGRDIPSNPSSSGFFGIRAPFSKNPHHRRAFIKCNLDRKPIAVSRQETTATDFGQSSPTHSWRNPRWLILRQKRLVENQLKKPDNTSHTLLFKDPATRIFEKTICAAGVLACLGFLIFSYVRFNDYTKKLITTIARETIHREIVFDRVVRCNPITGIQVKELEIQPSVQRPTSPTVTASLVDIKLSGFLKFLLQKEPLKLNVYINHAQIEISQMVVPGPKGVNVAQWDPGKYSNSISGNTTDQDVDEHLRIVLGNAFNFIQPGELSVRNTNILFHPAEVQDYGHGTETVEIGNASAIVTFPSLLKSSQRHLPFELDGDIIANANGIPVDGGTIVLQCFARGNTLLSMKSEDVAATLRVAGDNINAAQAASFINLPFRANKGSCSADISMDFLYNSASLVPIMSGQAGLKGVSLRFHPDPKTPELHDINGQLRFQGKTLFLDGPVAELGTLPMRIAGDIHLEDGYNLFANAREVDVNNILDTFDVEKFVPVQGDVQGEMHMTGDLEEPIIRGSAQAVGEGLMYDRVPLTSGKLDFEWDAIAGLLKFSDIKAEAKGGGNFLGNGSLFFDMTKFCPYGTSRNEHSARSPKAIHWNSTSNFAKAPPLRPVSEDPLEIDESAAFRPYDSMYFKFEVNNIDGGNLLNWYGGDYGAVANKSVGLLSAAGRVAGNAKDANCRVVWKSTSSPPEVFLRDEHSELVSQKDSDGTLSAVHGNISQVGDQDSEASDEPERGRDRIGPFTSGSRSTLGGGEFRGLIYLKLGDPPEARRVKMRTIISKFDARRAGWSSVRLRNSLRRFPLLKTSVDSYFKGFIFQKEILPLGATKMPRTPCMELLGADGALAVKNLSVNRVKFPNVVTGSFSFSASDFSLSLNDANAGREVSKSTTQRWKENGDSANQKDCNELTLAASLKGDAELRFRLGSSEVNASLSSNEREGKRATLSCKGVKIHDFMHANDDFRTAYAVHGTIDLNLDLDITSRQGKGRIFVRKPGLGGLEFRSVGGDLLWRDQNVFLRKGIVSYSQSEYRVNGRYGLPLQLGGDFTWDTNLIIHKANVGDITHLLNTGNAVATALHSKNGDSTAAANNPEWFQALYQSQHTSVIDLAESWEIPTNLPLDEQMLYYQQLMAEKRELRRQKRRMRSEKVRATGPKLSDIRGKLSGSIAMAYDSRLGDKPQTSSTASALFQAILDQSARTSFSFRLFGQDWDVAGTPVDYVQASGSFTEGVLDVGPFLFRSREQFGAEMECRVTSSGSLKASALLYDAPAELINKYVQAPVDVSGSCSGRVQLEGNITNPRALGRLVWTKAILNGKPVRGAKTDVACVNGRCLLNVNARIGGSRNEFQDRSDTEKLTSLLWNDSVVAALQDLAAKTPTKFEVTSSTNSKGIRRQSDETLSVRVSAPVRFYLRRYLQRRTPNAFWSVLEPILGGTYPIDDEWLLAHANVKKYGLLLLNTAFPNLGWEQGDSDINIEVSGTLQKPIVCGKVVVSDGRMWPTLLSEPLHSVRGEVAFSKNGIISVRHISGRCDGKAVNVAGEIFFSEFHLTEMRENLQQLENIAQTKQLLTSLQARKGHKSLLSEISKARSSLSKAEQGLRVEVGDLPISFANTISSRVSAKVRLTGVARAPIVRGSMMLSDGTAILANAGVSSRGISQTKSEHGRSQDSPTTVLESKAEELRKISSKSQLAAPLSSSSTDHSAYKSEGLQLQDFEIFIGRGMRVAQPLVLNVDVAGKLVMNGTTDHPYLEGKIYLLKGKINLPTSRMSIKQGEPSFVKFVKAGRENESPVVRLALEDEHFVIRVSESALSSWTDNIVIIDKVGTQIDAERWGRLMFSDSEGRGGAHIVKKVLENYVSDVFSVKGKLKQLEWKVFPALVSGFPDEKTFDFRQEVGAGMQLQVKGLTLTSKRSIAGRKGLKIILKVLNWLTFNIESEGEKQNFITEIRFPNSNDEGTIEQIETFVAADSP